MLFDTLKVSKALQRSFTAEQAETLAEVLNEAGTEELATKADLHALRTELKADFDTLRAEVKADINAFGTEVKADISAFRTEVKADLQTLRAESQADMRNEISAIRGEISALKTEGVRWIVGAIAFNLLGTAGLISSLFRAFAK